MVWEIAVVVGVFALPMITAHVSNNYFEEDKSPYFYWLRLLTFFFCLFIIDGGLWVTQIIASQNDSSIASILETAWVGYTIFVSFLLVAVLIIIAYNFFTSDRITKVMDERN